MGFILTGIAAAAVWIVLLSLGIKPFDALLVSMLMMLLAAAAHVVSPFLPGHRRDKRPGDGYIPR